MKIDKTFWFTGSFGTIGIVVGKDTVTKKKKAYIGTASGADEDRDTDYIAKNGSPVSLSVVREIVASMTTTGLVKGRRIILTLGLSSSAYGRIEAKVLEISPSRGMVKLEYLNGNTVWEEVERVHVVEVLSTKGVKK